MLLILKYIIFAGVLLITRSGANEVSRKPAIDIESCLKNQGLEPNQIVLRDRAETRTLYDSLNYQWSILYPLKFPMIYVLPDSSKDVQHIIYCSRLFKTRAVPKSGGHSYAKYAYGDSQSVVMDFQNFNAVSIRKESNIVDIGPGTRTGPLASQLQKSNYIFPIGLCPTVGIGITLGGGYVVHARKFGMISDSLTEVELVTPSASVLIANNETNEDLFWAIRGAGAGGAFGIVTRFTFKLHRAPFKYIRNYRYYNTSMINEVLNAYMKYITADYPADWPTVQVDIRMNYISMMSVEAVTEEELQFSKTETVMRLFPDCDNSSLIFEDYADFLAANKAYMSPFVEPLLNENDSHVESPFDVPMANKVKVFITEKILNSSEVAEFSKVILEMKNPFIFVNFLPLGGAVSHFKPTDTAFVHRNQRSYKVTAHYHRLSNEPHKGNCLLRDSETSFSENTCEPITTDADDLASTILYLEKFYNFTKTLFQHNATYQNDVDEDLPDFLERAFGEYLPRLKEIKAKFDPENYFHNPQSIPPA